MTGVSRSSAGQYLVLAAKPNGGRTIGLRRAQSYKALSDQLRRDRLVALKTWTLPQWAGREDKVSLKDQSELHLQLSQLLVRGVPLVEALEVTASAVAPKTKPRVERMKEMVSSGSSFSCLTATPRQPSARRISPIAWLAMECSAWDIRGADSSRS